jgi:hypothetical protein
MGLSRINDNLNKLMEPFKDFIVKNYSNPILWLVLFVVGLLLFFYTYNTLHKD